MTKNCSKYPRAGTAGFRAPEVILRSTQTSKIDVFASGIVLACIMFRQCAFFNPSTDVQQLLQFISIYGFSYVQETAHSLDRNLEARLRPCEETKKIQNNPLNKCTWVTGFEPWDVQSKGTMSYWLKKRCAHMAQSMEWSDELCDLLDKLTEFSPSKRPSPKQALEHKLFDCYQRD